MSISNTRHFIEKWGCGTLVGVILIIVMIASLFMSCDRRIFGGGESEQNSIVLGRVGEQPIELQELLTRVSDQTRAFTETPQGLDPTMHSQAYVSAFSQMFDEAVLLHVAKQHKIEFMDADIDAEHRKRVEQQFDGLMAQERASLVQQKKLAANATEVQFNEAMKKAYGADISTLKENYISNMLASPDVANQKRATRQQMIAERLREVMIQAHPISDDELKKMYATYVTKRIHKNFSPNKDLVAELKKVREDIVAGKMSFDQAMDKHSDDPAVQGAKRNQRMNFPVGDLQYDVLLEPILKLKPGEMTDVIVTATGPGIYHLIEIKPPNEAEFNKNKANYRKDREEKMANRRIFDELRAISKDERVTKWDSPVAKLLHEWAAARMDQVYLMDHKARVEKFKGLFQQLDTVQDSQIQGPILAYIRWGLYNEYYNYLDDKQRLAERDTRIAELQKITEADPHIDTLIELGTLAVDARKAEAAVSALIRAAEVNAGVDPMAEGRQTRLKALRGRIVALKLATPEQLTDIDAALQAWPRSVYDKLKLDAENNFDYTEAGQALWSETNANIEKYAKLGVLNAEQAKELRTLQAKWPVEKKKYDAEQAKLEAEAKKAAEEAEKAAKSTSGAPAPTPGGGQNPLTGATTGR